MKKKVKKAKKIKKADRPKQRHVGRQARNERHEKFCLEYVKDSNAARAAREAGYSEAAAREIGYHLLTYAHIKARIKQLVDERNARVLMEGDDILREIQKLAKSDIRRIIDPKTQTLLPTTAWPDDIAVCVSSIKVKELYTPSGVNYGRVVEVKLWDKPKPQELLGKNKKLFTDVIETTGNHTVTVADANEVAKLVDEVEKEV